VFVALVIQHAERMRRILLSFIACLALPYFFHIIPLTAWFPKKKYWNKICFDLF